MAMSGLFQQGLISLPNSQSEAVKAMIEQLSVWQPNPPRGTKTDVVMALWFAELRAQELVARIERGKIYRDTPFTTRGDRATRYLTDNPEYDPFANAISQGMWGN